MRAMTSPLRVILSCATVAACGCGDRASPDAERASPARTRFASADRLTLLRDDFSAASLDPMRWRVTLPPGRAPGLFVRNGQVVIQNRGHLNTTDEFDPAALGGLRITGEWTAGDASDDFLQILTRSDGIPVPPYGETRNGLEFRAQTLAVSEAPSYLTITGRGDASGTVTDVTSPGSLHIAPGQTYRFEVVDEGVAVRFTLTHARDPAQSRTVRGRSTYRAPTNLVTFHNRELCCNGSHTALLDNVKIERLARRVAIDIAPGDSANHVAPLRGATIAVAILSAADFDATTVDPRSARFGPGGAPASPGRGRREDVNGDGRRDLILEFAADASGIACGDRRAGLTAETSAHHAVRGVDAVEPAGCE
jgi:hypothetical protein